MGYRIIGVEFESPPIADEEAFLRQVAAFADSYGVGGILTPPERYPGQWEIILDANSSLLDGFTPYFIESVDVIANDIDPGSADLRALANYIGGACYRNRSCLGVGEAVSRQHGLVASCWSGLTAKRRTRCWTSSSISTSNASVTE